MTVTVNVLILILPFLLAIFYPEVGKLAGYLGSVSALGCIYVMPTISHLKSVQTQVSHPILSEAIKQNLFDSKVSDGDKSPQIRVDQGALLSKKKQDEIFNTTEEQRRRKYHIMIGVTAAIIAFGLFIVIAQYF